MINNSYENKTNGGEKMDYSSFDLQDTLFLHSLFKEAIHSQKKSVITFMIEDILHIQCEKIECYASLEEELKDTFCAYDYLITKENCEKIIVELAFTKTYDTFCHDNLLFNKENLDRIQNKKYYPIYQIVLIGNSQEAYFVKPTQLTKNTNSNIQLHNFYKINLSYIDEIIKDKSINELSPLESFAYLLEKGITKDIIQEMPNE